MSEKQTPFAKAYGLDELDGRLGKWLEVPAGRQGVVIKNGVPKTLSPGRHRVLSTLHGCVFV